MTKLPQPPFLRPTGPTSDEGAYRNWRASRPGDVAELATRTGPTRDRQVKDTLWRERRELIATERTEQSRAAQAAYNLKEAMLDHVDAGGVRDFPGSEAIVIKRGGLERAKGLGQRLLHLVARGGNYGNPNAEVRKRDIAPAWSIAGYWDFSEEAHREATTLNHKKIMSTLKPYYLVMVDRGGGEWDVDIRKAEKKHNAAGREFLDEVEVNWSDSAATGLLPGLRDHGLLLTGAREKSDWMATPPGALGTPGKQRWSEVADSVMKRVPATIDSIAERTGLDMKFTAEQTEAYDGARDLGLHPPPTPPHGGDYV